MGLPAIPIKEINSRLPKNSLLKAVEYVEGFIGENGAKRRMVRCKCKCGGTKDCVVAQLLRGNPLSCGCVGAGRPAGSKIERIILTKQADGTWKDDKGKVWASGGRYVPKETSIKKENSSRESDYLKSRRQKKGG